MAGGLFDVPAGEHRLRLQTATSTIDLGPITVRRALSLSCLHSDRVQTALAPPNQSTSFLADLDPFDSCKGELMPHRLFTTALAACAAVASLSLSGCFGGTSVTREDPNTVRDLSGNWNATDSREVAEAMIPQILGGAWISEHLAANDSAKPVVKVYQVVIRNQTDEYIDPSIFTDQIAGDLINSRQVRVVRASGEEEAIRRERRDQDVHASADTRNESFQELGADYLLHGSIKTQNDREGRASQRFYDITLVLEDVTTGERVWQGSHRHSKFVERSMWQ